MVASVARVIVLSVIGGLFWSVAPSALGWRPTTVMSDSMAPRILTGDVVVSMPAAPQLQNVGAILLVDDPDHAGRLRLHRMHDVTPEGEIITKGDANAQPDSSPITPDHVRGVAVLRIPLLGLPIAWAKYHEWGLIAAAGAGFLALLMLSSIDSDLRARGDAPPAASSRRGLRRRRRRARVIPAALLTGSASTVVLVLALTTGVHAAFAAKVSSKPSGWTTAADFACWPTATAADSPFFYYRFNSAARPTLDASGNGRTGAFGTGASNAAGTCPIAGASPALALDGTTNGTVAPAMPSVVGPNTFSIEAWFKTKGTGRIMGFGSSATGTSISYDRHLYVGADGKLVFGVYPLAYRTLTSPSAVNNNVWHHAVATLSSAGMRLYLDGALVASDPTTTAGQLYLGSWRVGYDNLATWPNVGATAFTGTLDNVAVYSTALTAAQVSSHYATGH